jgi:hypothetical protein
MTKSKFPHLFPPLKMIKSNFPSFFQHKKWQSSNFRTFSDLKNGKVQISKLFPNYFIRNSELYSESPATGNSIIIFIIIISSNVAYSLHDIADNCSFGIKQQSLTHLVGYFNTINIHLCEMTIILPKSRSVNLVDF